MRSRHGALAAALFLVALPTAVVCDAAFGADPQVTVHLLFAAGAAMLAGATFNFAAPRWTNWLASIASGALGAVFLLQAVALSIAEGPLIRLAFGALGQWPEGVLGDLVLVWLAVLLVFDSRGFSRALGWVAVTPAICIHVASQAARLQDAPAFTVPEVLRLLLLLPFLWLLIESLEKPIGTAARP